jgi:hypothetical protein
MSYSKSKNFYLVTHITGPTHNLLIIRLTRANVEIAPKIQMLPPTSGCRCGPPDEEAVLENVKRGAAEANAQLSTNYQVAEVRFVENDSKNETVYAYMTQKLIERIEAGEGFIESTYGDDEA